MTARMGKRLSVEEEARRMRLARQAVLELATSPGPVNSVALFAGHVPGDARWERVFMDRLVAAGHARVVRRGAAGAPYVYERAGDLGRLEDHVGRFLWPGAHGAAPPPSAAYLEEETSTYAEEELAGRSGAATGFAEPDPVAVLAERMGQLLAVMESFDARMRAVEAALPAEGEGGLGREVRALPAALGGALEEALARALGAREERADKVAKDFRALVESERAIYSTGLDRNNEAVAALRAAVEGLAQSVRALAGRADAAERALARAGGAVEGLGKAVSEALDNQEVLLKSATAIIRGYEARSPLASVGRRGREAGLPLLPIPPELAPVPAPGGGK